MVLVVKEISVKIKYKSNKKGMKNITNKDLQRMKELMGNKKPINESVSTSAVELVKKSPNGKVYGIVRENRKYFIKESNNGTDFDFIGGVANKTKNQHHSYEEAVRQLNLMFEDFNRSYNIQNGTNILESDNIQEKKFVIRTKKKSTPAPAPAEDEADGFDFGGGEDKGGDDSFDFGGDSEDKSGDDFDFGDEGDSGDTEEGGDDFNFGGDTEETDSDEGDEDLDMEGGDEEDTIKSIQKMTGKLGQKIRDTEDLSSDIMKWVAKSVLSALDLDQMDNEDKKDIIRTIKKKKDDEEGSDEEFDFMSNNQDPNEYEKDEYDDYNPDFRSNKSNPEMVNWFDLSDKQKSEVINQNVGISFPSNKPYDDEENEMDGFPGMETDWMSEDNNEIVGDENEPIYDKKQLLFDDMDDDYYGSFDGKDWYDRNDSKYGMDKSQDLEWDEETFNSFEDLRNSPYGKDKSNKWSVAHPKGEGWFNSYKNKFGPMKVRKKRPINYDETTKIFNSLDTDFMSKPRMNPQPAPSRPSTQPGPDVKPGRPDTDKPNPSKKPFTAPPFIKPGDDPNIKAKKKKLVGNQYKLDLNDNGYLDPEDFRMLGNKKRTDYMDDFEETSKRLSDIKLALGISDEETCPSCKGRGNDAPIGFGRMSKPCITCAGKGTISRNEVNDEVDEPYTDEQDFTPDSMYSEPSSTLPNNIKGRYSYREKTPTFRLGENSKKSFIREDHLNNEMVNSEQEQAYEDIESMARENGLELEYSDESSDGTVYLSLMRDNEVVGNVMINSMGDIEFDDSVDSYSNYNEILPINNNPRMRPQPAPSRPSTQPGPDVKPGRPDTDKPNPSKKPFTAPPFIKPGDDPNIKAEYEDYGSNESMDYMGEPNGEPERPSTIKPSINRPSPINLPKPGNNHRDELKKPERPSTIKPSNNRESPINLPKPGNNHRDELKKPRF